MLQGVSLFTVSKHWSPPYLFLSAPFLMSGVRLQVIHHWKDIVLYYLFLPLFLANNGLKNCNKLFFWHYIQCFWRARGCIQYIIWVMLSFQILSKYLFFQCTVIPIKFNTRSSLSCQDSIIKSAFFWRNINQLQKSSGLKYF